MQDHALVEMIKEFVLGSRLISLEGLDGVIVAVALVTRHRARDATRITATR
jgi:hypothetical protein